MPPKNSGLNQVPGPIPGALKKRKQILTEALATTDLNKKRATARRMNEATSRYRDIDRVIDKAADLMSTDLYKKNKANNKADLRKRTQRELENLAYGENSPEARRQKDIKSLMNNLRD